MDMFEHTTLKKIRSEKTCSVIKYGESQPRKVTQSKAENRSQEGGKYNLVFRL